jgi:hypothetical protein
MSITEEKVVTNLINYDLFSRASFINRLIQIGVMKKLILILVIIIASLNFLYTFGYQGEPMSQLEFLSRTLGSIIILVISLRQLMKKYNTKP